MSEVYSRRMREIVKEKADKLGIKLREGVYVQLTGPQYETPAEVRMCKIFGGDAVGMSTACEALAARHMGLEVCGISCITNLAAGLSDKKTQPQGSAGNRRPRGKAVYRTDHCCGESSVNA